MRAPWFSFTPDRTFKALCRDLERVLEYLRRKGETGIKGVCSFFQKRIVSSTWNPGAFLNMDFIVHASAPVGRCEPGAYENLNFSFREGIDGSGGTKTGRFWRRLSGPPSAFFVVNQVHEDRISLIDHEHPKPSESAVAV